MGVNKFIVWVLNLEPQASNFLVHRFQRLNMADKVTIENSESGVRISFYQGIYKILMIFKYGYEY